MPQLFPSLIAADLLNLRHEIELLEPHCDGFHVDIMDNHFVPNLTLGPAFVDAITATTAKPLWVQLMVTDPTEWIERLVLPANSCISIHFESEGQLRRNLTRMKEKNLLASIAINPETPVEQILHVLDLVDVVLLMSVNPGFSGQAFMPEVADKIKPLLGYRQTNGLKFIIGMDGGVGKENIGDLASKGVEWFSVGSAIFGHPNSVKAIKELRERIKK